MEIPTLWVQIYRSIPREGSSRSVNSYETPQSTLASIEGYSNVLTEVRETLLPILDGLDTKVVQPSMDMKKALEQVKKMVQKRHHKKVDYDRFTASVTPTATSLLMEV